MKGVSDNAISVAMVMVLPPKLSFCTRGNLVACHSFPNVGKLFRFSIVFWEEEVPEKYEFCK